MPKVPVQEIFSRGLVTSRPPHMLSSGELVRAGHTVYRENNPCIVRAPDHGLYSTDDLSTLLPSSTVTGLLAINLDREDSPDQIIAKVGRDLLISQVTGPDGNTFLPITSPGKVNIEVSYTPYVSSVNFSTTTATVNSPTTGAFDLWARIGRAVASKTACPAQDNYVIIGINYVNNNVASIVLSAPPVTTANEVLYFAPEVTLLDDGFSLYDESVGFSGVISSSNITSLSQVIVSTHNSPNYVEVNNAAPNENVTYEGACIGRKVLLTSGSHAGQSYFIEWMTFYPPGGTNSNAVQRLYLKGASFAATSGPVNIQLAPFTQNVTITAVDNIVNNSPIKTYNKCYLNWFVAKGTYELLLFGGLGRRFESNTSSIDGVSWDGTAFLWDGISHPYRVTYARRRHFHPSFEVPYSPIYRPVGLSPVTSPPTIELVSGQGYAWNPFLGKAQYWFMITESFQYDNSILPSDSNFTAVKDPVESAYAARSSNTATGSAVNTNTDTSVSQRTIIGYPISGIISDDTSQSFRITFPAPVNNGADGRISTHWNVYMAQGTKISTQNTSVDPTPPPPTSFHRVMTVPILNRTGGQQEILKDSREIYQLKIKNIAPAPQSTLPRVSVSPRSRGPHIVGVRSNQSWTGIDFELANSDATLTPIGTGPTANKTVYGIEVKTTAFSWPGPSDVSPLLLEMRTKLQSGIAAQWYVADENIHARWFGGPGEMWGLDPATMDLSSLTLRVSNEWYPNDTVLFGIKCNLYNASPFYPAAPTYRGSSNYGVESPVFSTNWTPLDTWNNAKIFNTNRNPADNQSPQVYRVDPDISVWLHLSGTSINLNGPIYKTVIYEETAGGTAIADPAMMPPPKASIGDTFQGALVLNDIDAPNFLRYSLPDRPEYFPTPYRMRMGTKRKGKITAIKNFKGVLIVGMERAIKRVNYLPTENDTDFLGQIGKAHEDVSESHGVVGPNAVAEFELPGVGAMLAYVSTIGLRVTDGSTTKALNTDVLLKDYVHPDHWEKCILKAYPSQKWLVLYYVPKEASHGRLTRSLVFSFSEDHLKGSMTLELVNQPSLTGPLSCTGPNDCFVVDATDAIIQSSPVVITTDGKYVYVEDSPASSVKVKTAAGNDDETLVERINAPDIKSRDIFPAGPTQDANISGIYVLHETKGSHFIRTDGTSTKGNTTLSFTSPVGSHVPVVGERVIHGGWDNVVTVLQVVDNYNIIVSAPAVRSVTTDAVYDTGNIMVRINAGQLGEDMVPILTEYRSTTVGVNQTFLMDGTANRFSVEISKVENPNTGFLMDLNEEMSIAGISYHVGGAGDAGLHVN